MIAKKRMTGPELLCWLEDRIEKEFEGNKSAAAREWGIVPAELFEVLGCRRSLTKKLIKAVGYGKDDTPYYVRLG